MTKEEMALRKKLYTADEQCLKGVFLRKKMVWSWFSVVLGVMLDFAPLYSTIWKASDCQRLHFSA